MSRCSHAAPLHAVTTTVPAITLAGTVAVTAWSGAPLLHLLGGGLWLGAFYMATDYVDVARHRASSGSRSELLTGVIRIFGGHPGRDLLRDPDRPSGSEPLVPAGAKQWDPS